MFTGIVTDLGRVKAVEIGTSTRFQVATAYDLSTVAIGASIACAGACLTVVEKGADYCGGMISRRFGWPDDNSSARYNPAEPIAPRTVLRRH